MSIFILYKISMLTLQFLQDFDITFYSFYQSSHRTLQHLKWLCHTSFFYPCGALFKPGPPRPKRTLHPLGYRGDVNSPKFQSSL